MPPRNIQDRGDDKSGAEDIVTNLVANTGTFAKGPCRAMYALTAGTFIGLMLGSGDTARTKTFVNAGELFAGSFKSRTGGTADVELWY
jgi:hypothetical protein